VVLRKITEEEWTIKTLNASYEEVTELANSLYVAGYIYDWGYEATEWQREERAWAETKQAEIRWWIISKEKK